MRAPFGVIEHYRNHFASPADRDPVTLGEGGTPLVPSRAIGPALGLDVRFKIEGRNPTGSFKDRGMTVAVTRARAAGARVAICASTGNTAASAAAYAARAGIRSVVLVPGGGVAGGKLAQAVAFGAEVWEIEGNFDLALALVREAAEGLPGVALVNSVNPDRLAGQRTAMFEILDRLREEDGRGPDAVILPVGNAGNISAYGMALRDLLAAGDLDEGDVPRLVGVQAEGAAPLVRGGPVGEPRTFASAIRIGNPASRELARQAVAETRGAFVSVPDDAIQDAQRRLAFEEGVFVEPASAAPVAGLLAGAIARELLTRPGSRDGAEISNGADAPARGRLPRVVCVLTGDGLKDPEAGLRLGRPARRMEASARALAKALRDAAGGAA